MGEVSVWKAGSGRDRDKAHTGVSWTGAAEMGSSGTKSTSMSTSRSMASIVSVYKVANSAGRRRHAANRGEGRDAGWRRRGG